MSDAVLDSLMPLLEGGNLQQIAGQLGISQEQAGTAVTAAVPLLEGAMQRNAATPTGLDSLAGALDRDHDGSILDDIGGFLGGGGSGGAGAGILGHVLGGRQGNVASSLGKSTGLDAGSVMQLLAMLAPLVLGMLGRNQRQQGLDIGGLTDLLGGERRAVEQKAPGAADLIGGLLDSDGDGSVTDDLAKLGGGLLGGLFGGK